eukprot:2215763-Rhodomonas_salina.1
MSTTALPLRAAISAASLHTFAMSAPANPAPSPQPTSALQVRPDEVHNAIWRRRLRGGRTRGEGSHALGDLGAA